MKLKDIPIIRGSGRISEDKCGYEIFNFKQKSWLALALVGYVACRDTRPADHDMTNDEETHQK